MMIGEGVDEYWANLRRGQQDMEDRLFSIRIALFNRLLCEGQSSQPESGR